MDKESIKAIKVATVKIKKGLFGGGIISDKKYVVILLGQQLLLKILQMWLHLGRSCGLAGFACQYFEYLLKDSKKV